MREFVAFTIKEFHHILRDPRTMLILLVMPVVLVVLFGYAITTEIKRSPVAILDFSRDEASRALTERLAASEYFEVYGWVESREAGEALLRQGKARLLVVFPPGFSGDDISSIQLLTDATDPNEATQLASYCQAILMMGKGNEARLGATTTLLYNPQMRGAYNFVPGVMGLILILICAMMTSVGIVREKEMGTMEVLLVSPLRPIYIILAKMVPYLLLSLVNIATILALSYFLLDVPIRGSLALLILISMLYAIVSLCLGLLISTVADTQQAAMLVSGIALMLPIILLSGMMFPVENMPWPLRWLSNIVPAKWYIMAVKDVMIKGLPWTALLDKIGILSLMIVVLVGISVRRFKVRLS